MTKPRQTGSGTISPAVSITTLGPPDAGCLARLHGEIFANPWSEDDFRCLLTGSGALGLAACATGNGAPVGFAILRTVADEAEILTFGVSRRSRRRGFGRALVAAILAHAAERLCTAVFLEVAEDNLAARDLYKRQGFELVGRRARYYRRSEGPAVDALVLSCRPGIAVDEARTHA